MESNYLKGPSCFLENQHTSCFDLLTPDQKELVRLNRIQIRYKKGETIAKQGSLASHIIFLDEGLVKVFLEGRPKDLILKIVPSNHLIGLPSIYDGNNQFIYSVATYTDSLVSQIDINIFKELLSSNPQFALKIINILNEDTALVYGRFFCLTMKQSHSRVADILLCLSKRVYKAREFHLAISRNDLADLTGLASESVIRILKDFKDEGLIATNGKKFTILNFEKLEKISEL
ncbi:MAG: Crp/Fnr family transcriptional regulator [Bacteroidales bacterium]